MNSLLNRLELLSSVVLLITWSNGGIAAEHTIRVSAGDLDRAHSVVRFELPRGVQSAGALQDPDGRRIPLQVLGREGTFILRQLGKGEEQTYRILPGRVADDPRDRIQVSRAGHKLKVLSRNSLVLEYQAEPGDLPRPEIASIYKRGGYIHPLLSPSGKLLTDDFARNHLHHHGIWFAWTKTEYDGRQPDFWNMGQGKGRVDFVALDDHWTGQVQGGFRARHRYIDLSNGEPVTVLNENWEVRIYNVPPGARPFWLFDMEVTQECVGDKPLALPKYHYGGLGFRGNWDWNGKDRTFFLTSEGEMDRVKANQTRGRWCHIAGEVNGELTGTAILCHPENYQAPQPMRVHPDEPFFCYAPSQAGDWQIAPGKPYLSRYRFVVFDGPPNAAELDRLWNDYASPVKVTVEP